MTNEVKPALLTSNELLWLQGKKEITNKHTERSMKSKIKRKIQAFVEIDMSLLSSTGYLRLGDPAGGCGASNQGRYLEPSPSLRSGSGGVVRLSISPSQGGDPGFKSRPEHFFTFDFNDNRVIDSNALPQAVTERSLATEMPNLPRIDDFDKLLRIPGLQREKGKNSSG